MHTRDGAHLALHNGAVRFAIGRSVPELRTLKGVT